jgi:hypothetical protein
MLLRQLTNEANDKQPNANSDNYVQCVIILVLFDILLLLTANLAMRMTYGFHRLASLCNEHDSLVFFTKHSLQVRRWTSIQSYYELDLVHVINEQQYYVTLVEL